MILFVVELGVVFLCELERSLASYFRDDDSDIEVTMARTVA